MKILKKFLVMWLSLSILTGCGGEKTEHVLPKSTETEAEKAESKVIETEETVKQSVEVIQKETQSAYKPQAFVEDSNQTYMNGCQPFYGIWFYATKSEAEAYAAADKAFDDGLVGYVFVTTDWSNLNKEKWYVVSVGMYDSETEARNMLPFVQDVYPDAYVKYSGTYQGSASTCVEPTPTYAYNDPFYGIWCFASKDYNAAVKAADEMVRRGYYANIFITTDWSNLNKEKWYVVSSGVYAYEEDAKAMLWSVQKDYPDAYVKFSGSWQGGYNDFDPGYCEPQNPPFYGIWVSATKDSNGAFDTADEVCSNGFDGQVFITTDWSNLNSERWYVIAAGTYANKADAEAMLSYVKQYYPNAYIKYSGEWQG